jgi:VWFA-related protein
MRSRIHSLMILALTLTGAQSITAQWTTVDLPVGARVTAMSATSDSGVFVIRNDTSMYYVNASGVTFQGALDNPVVCFSVAGSSIYVGTNKDVYRMTRSAGVWQLTKQTSSIFGPEALAVVGSSLFAADFKGVYRSSDSGQTWTLTSSGLPDDYVYGLVASGSRLYAGTRLNGVFISTNNGASWTAANTGLTNLEIAGFAVAPGTTGGTNIFVGTAKGIFVSKDNGTTWSASTIGLPLTNGEQMRYSRFAVTGTKTFAIPDGSGIFLSTDNGVSWVDVSATLPSLNVSGIAISGTTLYAGTAECGLYRSYDNGTTWTRVKLEYDEYETVVGSGLGINAQGGNNSVFVGTDRGVYHSIDNGVSWKVSAKGIPQIVVKVAIDHGTLPTYAYPSAQMFAFGPASDGSGKTYVFAGTDVGGVFISRDGGLTWDSANKGLPYIVMAMSVPVSARKYPAVTALAMNGSLLWAGLETGRVYTSSDNGSTWIAANTGIPAFDITSFVFSPSESDPTQSNVFVGTNGGGVYLSTNQGLSWIEMNRGLSVLTVSCLKLCGTKMIASTNRGVFVSADRGSSWNGTSSMYQDPRYDDDVYDLVISGTNFFASTRYAQLWNSADYGTNWLDITGSLYVRSGDLPRLAITDTDLWAATVKAQAGAFGSNFTLVRRPLSGIVPKGGVLSTVFNQIDGSGFPQLKAFVTITGSSQTPIAGLTSTNFSVKEDGVVESPLVVVPKGSSGSPVTVMIAIDKGESMTSAALSRAKTTASIFVEFLQASDSAAVLPFDNQVAVSVPFTSDRGALIEGIRAIAGSKASSIYDALYTSVQRLKTRTGSKAILLISAGIDQSSTHTESDVFSALESSGVPVYVIGFPAGARGEETLVRIAKTSNGSYFVEPGTSGLASIYDDIASALKNQYQITYTSHNAAADGSTRTVAITTSYNGSSGSQQKQYSAPTISTASSIVPTAAGVVPVGQPFWVEVKVGDPNTVKDLYGISFKLKSSLTACAYVTGSATAGSFLGTGPLSFFQSPDAQTISATVTKTAVPGVNGGGVVARFQFTTPASLTSTTSITFTLSDVQANTSTGASIPMSVGSAVIAASPSASIWPGDCDNNAIVNAADVLPIGLYYGQKNATTATANNPGIQWQAYKRSFWLSDSLGKKVYADADGNGVVDGADVLAVGLNYGKTIARVQSAELGKTVANQQMDGSLEIASVMRVSGKRLAVPIALKTTKPVYGIAFTLSISPSAKFGAVDTAGTVLGTSLMLTKPSDDLGMAEIGITSTNGTAFQGTGRLLTVMLDLEDNASAPITCDILNISANDARGNTLNLAGLSYRGSIPENGQGSTVPTEFGLSQNYPNPFNPSTNFELRIASPGFVTLKVFDMLGRVVASLVHQERAPGIYVEHWDASALPSGVYYFRMSVTELSGSVFTQTRRLMLVK